MKKIFTLLVFVIAFTTSHSQVIQKVDNYTWNGTTWKRDGLLTVGYNPGCSHYATIDSKVVDTATQAISNGALFTFGYSTGNNPTQLTTAIWNSISAMYINFVRTTYTYYNNTNQVATDLSERWNGTAWGKTDLSTNTYNSSGYKTDSLYQTWDLANSVWVNKSLTKFVNNSTGQPTSATTQLYNGTTLTDSQRELYTYNSSALLANTTTQYFDGTGFVTDGRITYTYNSSGKQTSELDESYDGTTYINSSYTTAAYDANENLITTIDQEWDDQNSVFVNQTKQEYTYGACGVLPLVLLNFTGTSDQDNMLLNWNTSAEVNTSHFDIQRSENGYDFNTIATLSGKGNSSSTLKYAYTDKLGNVLSTKIYYRLRMVDKDGSITFSNIVSLSTLANSLHFTIHPNPATSFFKVFTNKSQGTITMRNVLGSTVLQQAIKAPGDQLINTGQLSKGIYTITLATGSEVRSQRILIQ